MKDTEYTAKKVYWLAPDFGVGASGPAMPGKLVTLQVRILVPEADVRTDDQGRAVLRDPTALAAIMVGPVSSRRPRRWFRWRRS